MAYRPRGVLEVTCQEGSALPTMLLLIWFCAGICGNRFCEKTREAMDKGVHLWEAPILLPIRTRRS
jgi:hypothetical protein